MGLGIDDCDVVLAGHLDNAEFGIIGLFPHEFGIHRDERFGGQTLAKGGQRCRGGDEGGGGEGVIEWRHDRVIHGVWLDREGGVVSFRKSWKLF